MDLQELRWEDFDLCDMSQDRDRLRAVMNTVNNLVLLKTQGIS